MAKKRKTSNNNGNKIDEAVDNIREKYGQGSVFYGDDESIPGIPRWQVNSPSISWVLGGGIPSRIIEIYGPESCLSEDTHIPYALIDEETGKVQNHKGGTIKRLYERFHGVETGKPGERLRNETKQSSFFVSSMNDSGAIFRNKIFDVVKTGRKSVYRLTTSCGFSIKATSEHKFYTSYGFLELGSLSKGDRVYISKGDRYTQSHYKKFNHKEVYVQYHPSARWKKVTANNRQGIKTYEYFRCRVRESRLVLEAYQNGLSYEDYVTLLNTADKEYIDNLWFVPHGYHVHHIDENIHNNSIENLELIDGSVHNSHHMKKNHNKYRFIAVEDTIESIDYIGEEETYDIKCFYPYNNYIANGIVVHNSGKTSLAIYLAAEIQKQGGTVLYADFEHAADLEYAETLGLDISKTILSQPDYGEQGLNIIQDFCDDGSIDFVIIDSVAAITPLAEIEGDMEDQQMGLQARLLGKALRKISQVSGKNGIGLAFINQLREKIGVMFGSPETTPGGKALKFWSSIRLDMRKKEYIVEDKTNHIGLISRIKSIKNKTASPMRQAEVQIIFGEGFQYETEYVDFAISHGIVRKSGPWYYITNRDGEEAHKSQGKDGVVTYLRENPEMFDFIKEQVKAVMGLETGSSPVVHSEEEGSEEENE